MKNSKIINLVQIPLMTVIIVLCAWVCLPMPVPLTLQTFGIYSALSILGGKRGLCSILLYILPGAVGLPVFSGFSAGLTHLLSPTGGYIWGFILCALLYIFAEKQAEKSPSAKTLILFLGTLLCYTVGTIWFCITVGTLSSLWYALILCVFPFIFPDYLKIKLAVFLAKKLKPIINKTIKE